MHNSPNIDLVRDADLKLTPTLLLAYINIVARCPLKIINVLVTKAQLRMAVDVSRSCGSAGTACSCLCRDTVCRGTGATGGIRTAGVVQSCTCACNSCRSLSSQTVVLRWYSSQPEALRNNLHPG